MDTLKNVIAPLAIGIVLGLVVSNLTIGAKINTNAVNPVGAVTSPDIMSPYFSFGGVRQWAGHTDNLTSATTTVCAIQSPAATSTLAFGSVKLTTSSTTASVVTLAKAATPYATTTPFNIVSVAANAQVTVVASSTSPAADGTVGIGVFAPNQYLVVGMQGGVSSGTFSPVGTCNAVWYEN